MDYSSGALLRYSAGGQEGRAGKPLSLVREVTKTNKAGWSVEMRRTTLLKDKGVITLLKKKSYNAILHL